MNQLFYMIALIFLLLSFTTIAKYSARELTPRQGKKMKEKCVSCTGEVDVKINSMESQESVTEMKDFASFNKLMGLEENNSCEEGLDEEDCLKRRDTLEAHLDYIYTQQHKP